MSFRKDLTSDPGCRDAYSPKLQSPFVYERVSGPSLDCKDGTCLTAEKGDGHERPLYTRKKRSLGTWAMPWVVSPATLTGVCIFLAACLKTNIGGAHSNGKCGGSGSANVNSDTPLGNLPGGVHHGPQAHDTRSSSCASASSGATRRPTPTAHDTRTGIRSSRGPFVSLTPAEAAAVDGAQEFRGEYPVTATVQRSLHYLKSLRQAVYGENCCPDVVSPPAGTASFWPHVKNCVETVRQVLECGANTTRYPCAGMTAPACSSSTSSASTPAATPRLAQLGREPLR
ncbi:hypothetical protein DL767_005604 [Monosporascus sp. MG133]|nr:hypothetical protein DL767_005604 [Monosporascus sp. MG133]